MRRSFAFRKLASGSLKLGNRMPLDYESPILPDGEKPILDPRRVVSAIAFIVFVLALAGCVVASSFFSYFSIPSN